MKRGSGQDTSNWYLSNGMVLNLYKYYVRPKENYEAIEEFMRDPPDGKDRTLTTFGNFDRVGLVPVRKFEKYQDEACSAYPWLGNRQSIMLYAIASEEKRRYCFLESSQEDGYREDAFAVRDEGQIYPMSELPEKRGHRFLMITFLYAAGAAKARLKGYSCFLDYCQKGIDQVVAAFHATGNGTIGYELFGTFNSAELAVMWDCASYSDVLYLIDHLRHMELVLPAPKQTHQRLFISSYTFVAFIETAGHDLESGKKTPGGMLLQLAGRTGGSSTYENIKEYLHNKALNNGEELLFTAGEYDVVAEKRDMELLLQFSNKSDAAFDAHNKEFCETFLETTTRLYYRQEDVANLADKLSDQWEALLQLRVEPSDWGGDVYSTEPLKPWERLQKQDENESRVAPNIREKFKKLSNRCKMFWPTGSDGFLKMLDLLYIDYVQCVTTAVDHLWTKDFDAQFEAVLDVLLKIEVDDGKSQDGNIAVTMNEFIEMVEAMSNSLQQQICHISDSGKLSFEEPRSHFSYTGQWDLLMHTYYGILKALLEAAYKLDRPQSRLYPLLNLGSISYLNSRLYYEGLESPKEIRSRSRFLAITLPSRAWISLGIYIPALVHELYHYIAPKSRKNRNHNYGCILMTIFFSRLMEELLPPIEVQETEEETQAIRKVRDNILELCKPKLAAYSENQLNCIPGDVEEALRACYLNWLTNWMADIVGRKGHFWVEIPSILNEAVRAPSTVNALSEIKTQYGAHALEVAKGYLFLCTEKFDCLAKAYVKSDSEWNDLWHQCDSAIVRTFESDINEIYDVIINEMFPDVAMAHYTGMDVSSYLLHFSVQMNSRGIKPQEMSGGSKYRISQIIDWLGGWPEERTGELDRNVKKDFVKMYESLFPTPEDESTTERYVSANDWLLFFDDASAFRKFFYAVRHYWQDLIKEEFVPCLARSEALDTLQKQCQNYFHALRDEERGEKQDDRLFKLSIEIAHAFQIQNSLRKIEEIIKQYSPIGSSHDDQICPRTVMEHTSFLRDKPKKVYTLRDPGELNQHLLNMIGELKHNHKEAFHKDGDIQLWYRGVWNEKFQVLPSILVHFWGTESEQLEDFDGKNEIGTLWEYQRYLLERFKLRADGAPERLQASHYDPGEYLALMQHYAQYTGFMDWSEDAYTSLYFALEGYVDGDKDKIIKQKNGDACLYILDPVLYNRARQMLMQKLLFPCKVCKKGEKCRGACEKCNTKKQKAYANTWQGWEGHIPNISLPQERARYWMFLGEDRPKEMQHSLLPKLVIPPEEAWKHSLNLPLAIYTSRLNPRIRAQSGLFLAYDLNIPVVWQKGGCGGAKLFEYISLGTIQEKFLELCPEELPFMMKLIIKQPLKKRLGEELRSLGINRFRIYPELEQLRQN